MTLLAVTGLRREARIVASDSVIAISGGGDRDSLTWQIESALRAPVRGIVSFGIAGALAPALEPGDLVIASCVIHGNETFPSHAGWLKAIMARLPDAHLEAIAGSHTMLTNAAEKSALYRMTGAAAVDMESHIAARAAQRRGLPFVAIRTISDAAERALPPAALAALKPDGGVDIFGVARSLVARPAQIPALIRTARESERAFAALLGCLSLLGPRLACPDTG
jgi:adenosylhomocysteine nucleosidase